MKRHLFLCGDRGCGKTTLVQTLLKRLGNPKTAGFVTIFDAPRDATEKSLYLFPAAAVPAFDTACCVAKISHDAKPMVTAYPAVFDTVGTAALAHPFPAEVVIMDECGGLERHAVKFQQGVLAALEGATPVLGVLHYKPSPFTEQIRQHPAVQVLEITVENRLQAAQTAYDFFAPLVLT